MLLFLHEVFCEAAEDRTADSAENAVTLFAAKVVSGDTSA